MSLVVLQVDKNSFRLLLVIINEKIQERKLYRKKICEAKLFLDGSCLCKITSKSNLN